MSSIASQSRRVGIMTCILSISMLLDGLQVSFGPATVCCNGGTEDVRDGCDDNAL